MKKRDPYFDVLKFLAMYMVVAWHIMDATSDVRSDLNYSVNFIMAVNMPLFFAISGYFASGFMRRLTWCDLFNRFIGYFWPIVIFGIARAILTVLWSAEYTILDLPLIVLKNCLFRAWFFYALAICEAVVFCCNKLGQLNQSSLKLTWTRSLTKLCLVIPYLVTLCLPEFWYKRGCLNMMPFYLFGLYALPKVLEWKSVFRLEILGFFAFVLYLLGVVFGGNFWQNGMAFYTNHIDIYNLRFVDVEMMWWRLILGICGIVGVMGVVRVIMKWLPWAVNIAPLGTLTLGIYFVHGWFTWLWYILVGHSSMLFLAFVGAAFAYGLSFCIVWLSKRNAIVRGIIWGFKFNVGD